MEPNIHINMLAVVIAVAANFILGWVWYGPVFGKAWGKEMGYDMTGRKKDVLIASLHLHDVGKIGIPDHILMKPASLNEEEWKIMRQHPVKGAKILEPLSGFKEVANVVLHHHENYDGTGYPEGLKGEAIPLEARIVAVVDAFHAIVSKRCYSKGRSIDAAFQELERCAGTQFDPHVVEAFIRAYKRTLNGKYKKADHDAHIDEASA